MTTEKINLLPFPVRPTCGHDWCVVDDGPEHPWHYSQPEGPRTIDEDEDVISAAVARRFRAIGADMVEVLVWDLDDGGRTMLLSPDEADALAQALTDLARQCRDAQEDR